eukprot:6194516-Pleurochrysis_carterae.AAC.4
MKYSECLRRPHAVERFVKAPRRAKRRRQSTRFVKNRGHYYGDRGRCGHSFLLAIEISHERKLAVCCTRCSKDKICRLFQQSRARFVSLWLPSWHGRRLCIRRELFPDGMGLWEIVSAVFNHAL